MSIFVIAMLFALGAAALPSGIAFAQDIIVDGEYGDGEHEGKQCPSKEQKTAGTSIDFNS